MTFVELLPALHTLPRAEKLQLIQLLAADVAREEGITVDLANEPVSIWSPHSAFEGAATLLSALDADRAKS